MKFLPWRRKKPPAPQPRISPEETAQARQERIERRLANDAKARDPAILLTTNSYPIYYLPITKCGCTFLKNLFYALDNGDEHPAGINVHEEEDGLVRSEGQDFDTVFGSPYSFSVLRDPASRFMSFYFDKIWGEGAVNFPKIRAHLEEIGVVDLDRDLDAAEHRANVYRLLEWVGENLEGGTDLAINYHWRPQTSRLRRARMFKLNHLTLDGLDWQLPMLMAPVVPDMAERMQAVKSRNRSDKPASAPDVLDNDLAAAIRKLYRADTILHERARNAWQSQSPERRQGAFECPPMLRHRRVQRLIGPGSVSLTTAACTGGAQIKKVLGKAGVIGGSADIPLETLAQNGESALTLLRDPLERFGAVYNFMMERPRRSGFANLRTTLIRRRGFIAQPVSPDDHAHNLSILATYMRRRKADFIDSRGYAGSRLQSHDVRRLIDAGGIPIFTDRLADELPGFLNRPELGEPLAAISAQNRLPDDIAAALTGPVAEAVRSLYRTDCDLYDGLRIAAGLRVSGDWAA